MTEDVLYEHHRLRVDRGQNSVRIDKYLAGHLANISRSRIQNASKAGNVLVNEKQVRPNYRVKPADVISIVLPFPPRDTDIIPENIPLEIVYEDQWIMLINKKPGMVVHPAKGNVTGTLMNALYGYFGLSKCTIPLEGPDGMSRKPYPFLVHRLDKNTSGLIVVAKDVISQAKIAKQFFDRTVRKKYLALVWGDVKKNEGLISGNIGRSRKNRKVMDVFGDESTGKPAETYYRVLDRYKNVTLLECAPKTGRTHQIRIHCKHIGHPLFGDKEYGGDKVHSGDTSAKFRQFITGCLEMFTRQALHAASLGFVHPETGKEVHFTSPLPGDFDTIVRKMKEWSERITNRKV
ncbi:MAG: RluA family pseudouridine synthase [Bacteroidetes bacterium]|nr:RluA family pseudouridine synthase [Bacteroidota bacterium]